MPTRRCCLFLSLVCGLVLSGCTGPLADRTVDDPYGGAQIMAAEGGMLRLPPDWEQRRLLTLRQVEDGVLTEQAIGVPNRLTIIRDGQRRGLVVVPRDEATGESGNGR